MSSSIVYSRTTCNLSSSHRPSLHRALAVNRIEKRRTAQSRSLWWWSRHGTWSSANEHDNVEERLRRQQKIMSYRYSRALRRRAVWDRDNSPPSWLWRGPTRIPGRRWGCKPLSTSEHMQAKLKEEESGIPRQDKPWEEFHRDFESFKAAVDKAIEKDPYGYLFGRRLRSVQNPTSDNNSLWNPFMKIFNHQESKRGDSVESKPAGGVKRIKIENLDESKNAGKPDSYKAVSTSSSPPPDDASRNQTQAPEEYVYDPISGRKVLKVQIESKDSHQPKKHFLQALFAEHGADETGTKLQAAASVNKVNKEMDKKAFENSRTREYLQLRAATIGTSIDTTAAFGGKYEAEAEVEEEVPDKRVRTSLEPEEDVPLYSGTIYARSETLQSSIRPDVSKTGSSWLQQEGFKQPSTREALSPTPPKDTGSGKLQPAFDRMSASHEQQSETKYIAKLQPALDRMDVPRPLREARPSRPAPLDVTNNIAIEKPQLGKASGRSQTSPDLDKREDLDLLRASDIRAATKTARITKQEVDQANSEARRKLEVDYTNRQKAAEASSDVDSARTAVRSTKTAKSIASVMKHMQRYPDGIVAKTMKSMGVFNDNFKKYQKSYGHNVDLTQKLELKPEALDKLPSIYKDVQTKFRASMAPEPSVEAMETENAKAETTKAVKAAKQEALEQQEKENIQIKDLASTIKQIYQTHTDLAKSPSINEATAAGAPTQGCKDMITRPAHPLQTATVRPGVQRYPEIERHTQEFEPKLIEAREQLKAVSKSTAELRIAMAALSSEKALSKDTEQPAPAPRVQQIQILPEASQKASAVTSSGVSKKADPISSEENQTSFIRTDQDKQKTEKRLEDNAVRAAIPQTLPRALEMPPSTPISSPYVLLTYNPNSKEVNVTQLNKLMSIWQETSKVNPISVMSELNHAAAFVMRFAELERTGYTLLGGGGDVLIFRKQEVQTTAQKDNKEALESIRSIKSVISEIRNKIAAEEARSQPVFPSITPAPTPSQASKRAATVLDEIPTSIPNPTSPPPTAPLTSLPKVNKKKPKDSHKVRRQEQVFSGTIRPNAASKPDHTSASATTSDETGFFTRLFRTIRRVTLTIGALGGVAYAIGVVSEGLSAHAQHQRAIANGTSDEGQGPRRKVVITNTPTTRPGFFSTESTRD